ncbi:phenylacetate--CoA ligase family protein [Micromonospora saelicesensis]|uniref:phenylacetate--CoA ligase family protein n=1 Tax=Micromonospora saelicesensis TaxID=285676 RepID=UPI000DC49BE4|nr:phenylacetate--CoA ligase family protein [Micromonospora saelicesensis]RAO61329.1 Phenylacetate--CoA ligase [Micromonospora saelicesensis]
MDRSWLGRAVLRARHQALARKVALYDEARDRTRIERHQVRRFNEVWEYCLAEVPFYRSWRREHGLPERIDQLGDLRGFPPLTKEVLIARQDEIFQNGRIRDAYTTGGSTGQPTRYPRGAGEADGRWVDAYLGRHWAGVRPTDPGVLLWGHSHLFGAGLPGQLAQMKRRLADLVVNVTRLNAYDLSEPSLHKHYLAVRQRDPVALTGYTSAVFKLARYIERNQLDLGEPRRLRAVVLCAETASDADIAMVERVFKVPAVIEYGSAETGVLAMSHLSTRDIRVIWDSFVCLTDGDGELSVTTLADRLFPLVHYAIGDRVEPSDVVDGNALAFRAVLGRQQDIVRVGSARGLLDLSAILPVHILKSYPGIIGVQFRQVRPDALRIHVEADRPLDLADVGAYFVRELRKDHPELNADSISFAQISDPARTRAGKHALFVP